MKAFGCKRQFGGCRTTRPIPGGKIHVSLFTKSRKLGRQWSPEFSNAYCLSDG